MNVADATKISLQAVTLLFNFRILTTQYPYLEVSKY
jgi:hypothetical protein